MSATPPTIEWFIARDGVQHGPISDVEMMKFVELGHLRGTDLVWCARFTEWKPGSVVFPAQTMPKPPAPPAPAPQPQPQAQPQPQFQPQPQAPAQAPSPGPSLSTGGAARPQGVGTDDAAWAAAMREVVQGGPTPASNQPQFGARPGEQTAAPLSAPSTGPAFGLDPGRGNAPDHGQYHSPQDALGPGPGFGPASIRGGIPDFTPPQATGRSPDTQLTQVGFDDDSDDEPPRSRGWISRATVGLAVLLIVGGLGWLGWQNRNLITGAAAIPGMLVAKIGNAPSPELLRTSPYDAPGETRDIVDVSLQKTAVWRLLKKEFGDWYGERLGDVQRMREQKTDEKVVSKFMADVIVTLRRRNAVTALQSSPDHLKRMASAFVANLKQMASRDGQTCHGFITFGEAHPFMVELARTPAFAETLQGQLVAVFEAIADGRANRRVHPTTRRNDYDALTKELTARGWSQNDLATFSDPQKLSKSPPDKVCQLVQDWFNTQLALTDSELQSRLLAESLKPLVGG